MRASGRFVWPALAVIGIAVVVVLTLSRAPIRANEHPQNDLQFVTEVTSVLRDQAQRASDSVTTSNDYGVWWITRDGHAVINDDSPVVTLSVPGCDVSTAAVPPALIRAVAPKARATLLAEGFVLNARNSSRSAVDDRFYDYVQAYERGDIKAVLVISPDCAAAEGETFHSTVVFSYTSKLQANAAKQLPMLRDLGLGSDVIIHVAKREADLAMINVNYRRTGHYIVARLTDGHWKQLIAGQDVPTCAETTMLGIPRTFMDCYTPDAA